MSTYDPTRLKEEMEWLKKYPHFYEKPASIEEFFGPEYLNIEKRIRPGVRRELVAIFGKEANPLRIALVRLAMFTGAIGIGKTTMASIVIPYMAHWVLCLRDPQDFYELLPGSRIAFMQMSTSDDQAVETVFGDIKARIEHSPWFMNNYPYDPSFKKQLRFPKDIWILPGNSTETAFEGYNILGGILDEADSHKQTKDKDYAQVGYDTIKSRIDSRFDDKGFLLVIGQMKKSSGFAARTYKDMSEDPEAHTVRMSLWESLGWGKYLKPDGSRDSFWYDPKRKEIIPEGAVKLLKADGAGDHLIEIPKVYEHNFKTNPEKALRDLAGIPPAAGDPFISLTYKIEEAVERWIETNGPESPVNESSTRPEFADWFRCQTPLKRHLHVDYAYSADGDALGMAMGHVKELLDIDGEEKPYISFDFLLRIHAAPGTEIMFQDVRRIIYRLKDELGFRIRTVSMDGFESTDTKQQLRKRKFNTEKISVDKSKLPYEDLRDAIYEDRVEFPPYYTKISLQDMKPVQVAVKELMELEEDEKKIDHPTQGSKDVADAMAGVTTGLMGDRSYRRGVSSQARDSRDQQDEDSSADPDRYRKTSKLPSSGPGGLQAPVPPSSYPGQGVGLSMPIPPRLMPGRK